MSNPLWDTDPDPGLGWIRQNNADSTGSATKKETWKKLKIGS
jgi:hypothetical protein